VVDDSLIVPAASAEFPFEIVSMHCINGHKNGEVGEAKHSAQLHFGLLSNRHICLLKNQLSEDLALRSYCIMYSTNALSLITDSSLGKICKPKISDKLESTCITWVPASILENALPDMVAD